MITPARRWIAVTALVTMLNGRRDGRARPLRGVAPSRASSASGTRREEAASKTWRKVVGRTAAAALMAATWALAILAELFACPTR